MAAYEFFSIELLRSTISAQPVYRRHVARVCSRIKYPTPGDQSIVKTEVNAPRSPGRGGGGTY